MSVRFSAILFVFCSLLAAGEFPIGSRLNSLSFSGPGAPAAIQTSAAKATVVVFVSVQCPVSNSYNGRLASLYTDYSSQGVQFAFVNANATESLSDVEAHEKRVGWPFQVVKDKGGTLADKLGAEHTPEAFVFDQHGTLVYHGRVDDSMHENEVKQRDLRAALDAVLAGRAVPVAETRAFGCSIKRAPR
ncbi:MAG: redoxin domain-containing protein [Bryobacteraceae bacterium]